MLSLPYTAVEEAFEGRGIYRTLKAAMLTALQEDARVRDLPDPTGNVSEERPGSAQYRRKVEGGIAVVLPIDYRARRPGPPGNTIGADLRAAGGCAAAFVGGEARAIVGAIYRRALPDRGTGEGSGVSADSCIDRGCRVWAVIATR
jgi:hypothetical protein